MQLRSTTCTGLLQKRENCGSLNRKEKLHIISIPYSTVDLVHCKGLTVYLDTKSEFYGNSIFLNSLIGHKQYY